MQKYFLGVDGGNSKTDYLLCTIEGTFVDVYRTDTCSHEQFNNGFDGMERAMREQLSQLFSRNGISISDIVSAGFGLAGADLPEQIKQLKERVDAIGFTCYGLANDGILGIKGASDNGIGLCAVNGAGTVVIGMDEKGEILQVGGTGSLSGDSAGGAYIRNQIITRLYSFHYRCGENSVMFSRVMELLQTTPQNLPIVISDYKLLNQCMSDIVQIGAKAALDGDKVAKEIFDAVGTSIGQAAAGCIRLLSFDEFGTVSNPIDIVRVGSIWHRIPYEGMNAAFVHTVQELSGKKCSVIKLEAPPAVGGVLWAKEIADDAKVSASYRQSLLEAITLEKYDALAFQSK